MGILMLNGNNYTGGIQQVYGKSSGNIATFDDGGDNKPLKSLKVAINPVQASGTPSPSNPLPISGWTGCNVVNDGGIIQTYSTAGTTTSSGATTATILTTDSFELKTTGNVQYPASKQLLSGMNLTNGKTYRIYAYVDFKTITTKVGKFGIRNTSNTFVTGKSIDVFEQINNQDRGLIYFEFTYDDSTDNYLSLVQLRNSFNSEMLDVIVSQIKIFEVNNSISTVYPITWSEAGNIYKGYIDYERKKVVATHKKIDISTLTYNTTSWGAYRASLPDSSTGASTVMPDALASKYEVDTYQHLNQSTPSDRFALNSKNVYIVASESPTGDLLYPLATPIEYDLDEPLPNIRTLLGNNNIWADSGEILECVYQRDLNIVINQFDERITALEQALNSSGTRSLSLSKSAVNEEETNEEITEEPKEEEQNEDKR